MEPINEFVDERQKTWCIHCTRSLATLETTKDHVPTRGLLRKPNPHHLPVVIICKECNNGFSRDEQYVATFLSCVLSGSARPEDQISPSARRALSGSPALQSQIERSRTQYRTLAGEARLVWQPDAKRVENVVLKNARGHAFFEFGEPLLARPESIWFGPLESLNSEEREIFEGVTDTGEFVGWPEVGSRMMSRLVSGADMERNWVSVQEGTYRYSVQQAGGILVRSVWSEYLATEVFWEE